MALLIILLQVQRFIISFLSQMGLGHKFECSNRNHHLQPLFVFDAFTSSHCEKTVS